MKLSKIEKILDNFKKIKYTEAEIIAKEESKKRYDALKVNKQHIKDKSKRDNMSKEYDVLCEKINHRENQTYSWVIQSKLKRQFDNEFCKLKLALLTATFKENVDFPDIKFEFDLSKC